MKSLYKIVHLLPTNQYPVCFLLLLAMLVGGILEAVGIGAILPLISVMGDEAFLARHDRVNEFAGQIGISSHTEFVLFCAGSLVVIYLLKNLFIGFESWWQFRFVVKNQVIYSSNLFAEYLSRPYLFHINHNTAQLLRNVNNGGMVVFSNILLPLLSIITEFITAAVIWLMLVFVEPFAAIVVAGIMGGILLAIIKSFRKRIAKQGIIQKDYQTKFLKWLNQGLGAIKETKVMHKENHFLQEFDNAYGFYGWAMGRFDFLNTLPRLFIETVVVSGLLFLIIAKMLMGNSPTDIVPLLGVLAMAAFRLMPSANRIVNFYNAIKFNMPFFHEIYPELYAIRQRLAHKELDIMPNKTKKLPFNDHLTIKNLGFHYADGKAVLEDVSFTIPKGKFVGIMGQSGAGKTTFVDILLGLLPPSKGSILVDGHDIQSDIRGWQENIAYVPQSIYLIDGSIKENIAMGTPLSDIDETKITKALKMAELYDVVQDMPGGINTMVGERGVRLSGGQRQRIGIARALYQEPEVLILDEATSALDNETEKSITETILRLKGQLTIIAIAHRVSTLDECDFKVKFEEGKATVLGDA